MAQKLSYKRSGVDVAAAHAWTERLGSILKDTGASRNSVRDFGGAFDLGRLVGKDCILVSSADGVGTKLRIAQLCKNHRSVGIDLVGMNVNDVVAAGAKPLFFCDYISTSQWNEDLLVDIVKGIAKGCKESGCVLVGGETAQMPGFYKADDYDLAGFCVGMARRSELLGAHRVRGNAALVGLASSGLHSNGFSLVRKILGERRLGSKDWGPRLLKPTRLYAKLIEQLRRHYTVQGIAHITGGSFEEKLPRILPPGLDAVIDRRSWPVPKLFRDLQRAGSVPVDEMYRTFNMGIGMILVVSKDKAAGLKNASERLGCRAWIIGETAKGNREVRWSRDKKR
ncbi:MAG: phosphoribosylformylglycinamidine cyclo-ligase [Candidatus Omnitrophica bacterium]|nr:phosphoribosylformylglycinamidine cyclo-ligase [Candidatus Omnitrophota bacterium]